MVAVKGSHCADGSFVWSNAHDARRWLRLNSFLIQRTLMRFLVCNAVCMRRARTSSSDTFSNLSSWR